MASALQLHQTNTHTHDPVFLDSSTRNTLGACTEITRDTTTIYHIRGPVLHYIHQRPKTDPDNLTTVSTLPTFMPSSLARLVLFCVASSGVLGILSDSNLLSSANLAKDVRQGSPPMVANPRELDSVRGRLCISPSCFTNNRKGQF